jgi:predicted SAM-dependent methyltransferase
LKSKIKKVIRLLSLWIVHRVVFGKWITLADAKNIANNSINDGGSIFDATLRIYLGNENFLKSLRHAKINHLYFIHQARLKMVTQLLPKARRILDIGGANCPLYEMGYNHDFEYMCMVDLPVADRHEDFKKVWSYKAAQVETRYISMTDLKGFSDNSFDLVWMGQVVEHVSKEDALLSVKEAHRVLAPGGLLIMDTPNRRLTKIHVATEGLGDRFIHPEHKFEYEAHELKELAISGGFDVTKTLGICEMNQSAQKKSFFYEDFFLGNPISNRAEDSYILYIECKK